MSLYLVFVSEVRMTPSILRLRHCKKLVNLIGHILLILTTRVYDIFALLRSVSLKKGREMGHAE
eukprot:scaffold6927_cov93-Cylindrotheca_fusiformis.AAC.7